MKDTKVDLGKTVLYTVSGGLLTAAFAVMGAAAAQAAPLRVPDPPPATKPQPKPEPGGTPKQQQDEKRAMSKRRTENARKATPAPLVPAKKATPVPQQQEKKKAKPFMGPVAVTPDKSAKDKLKYLEPGDTLQSYVKRSRWLPNNAGGGGVAISSDQGPRDARDPKKKLPASTGTAVNKQKPRDTKDMKKKLPEKAGGGGVAVSDQLGDARRTSVSAAKSGPDAKQEQKPRGSVSVCAGGALAAVVSSAGAKGCLVADSKGLGWSTSERVGLAAGIGVSGSIGVEGSTAGIEDLAGESVSGGVGVHAVAGGEVSGSITRDGKNVSGGASVGVGGGAKVYAGPEYTQSGRFFDWPSMSPDEQADSVRDARRWGR
ncbi:hypothetical protein AB5J62_14365 [Amycolatopsis sp. cg5]|uniref:hypothetical protein n=1 Tax=Amycolatopsis sp. cg5 TaxID=3238802 RepID=UPI0035257F53